MLAVDEGYRRMGIGGSFNHVDVLWARKGVCKSEPGCILLEISKRSLLLPHTLSFIFDYISTEIAPATWSFGQREWERPGRSFLSE